MPGARVTSRERKQAIKEETEQDGRSFDSTAGLGDAERIMPRPNAAGRWLWRMNALREWDEVEVFRNPYGFVCRDLMMRDNSEGFERWQGEWVGPLTPPVSPNGGLSDSP